MPGKDRGKYGKKHPPERKPLQGILDAVKQRTAGGEITCAVAHLLSKELQVPPAEVGFTIDHLEIPITACQLGLFGYRPEKKAVTPASSVALELEQAVRGDLVDGKLPCAAAWEIAVRLKVTKMDVSSACEALKIKISPCQLGVF